MIPSAGDFGIRNFPGCVAIYNTARVQLANFVRDFYVPNQYPAKCIGDASRVNRHGDV